MTTYYYSEGLGMREFADREDFGYSSREEALCEYYKRKLRERHGELVSLKTGITKTEEMIKRLNDEYGHLVAEYPEFFV